MRIRVTQSVIVWAVGVGWLSGVHLVARVERQVVGQVVSSSGAFLEGVPIPNQGTILDGDSLTTGRGGSGPLEIFVTPPADNFAGAPDPDSNILRRTGIPPT